MCLASNRAKQEMPEMAATRNDAQPNPPSVSLLQPLSVDVGVVTGTSSAITHGLPLGITLRHQKNLASGMTWNSGCPSEYVCNIHGCWPKQENLNIGSSISKLSTNCKLNKSNATQACEPKFD